MSPERARAATAIGALAALALLALVRPAEPPPVPVRVDPAACEPWMADCLPGVGAKRRDAAVEAVRAGRIDELTTPARSAAGSWFETAGPRLERTGR